MTDQQFATVVNGVRLLMAAVAAICSFLLVQPDLALQPEIKVVLGAIIVALAVLNPGTVAAKATASRR